VTGTTWWRKTSPWRVNSCAARRTTQTNPSPDPPYRSPEKGNGTPVKEISAPLLRGAAVIAPDRTALPGLRRRTLPLQTGLSRPGSGGVVRSAWRPPGQMSSTPAAAHRIRERSRQQGLYAVWHGPDDLSGGRYEANSPLSIAMKLIVGLGNPG